MPPTITNRDNDYYVCVHLEYHLLGFKFEIVFVKEEFCVIKIMVINLLQYQVVSIIQFARGLDSFRGLQVEY